MFAGTTTTTPATPTMPKVDVKPMLHELAHIGVTLWWLWLLLIAAAAVKFGLEWRETRRLARSGIDQIDAMDGLTFELFLGTLFRRLGYEVQVTKYRGDWGADLVVAKDGRRIAVQAKRWSKPIGVKAVQEAVASKAMYSCDGALVVSNRTFTTQARRLADANAVALWDRSVLIERILEAGSAPDTTVSTDSCHACGAPVSAKVRDYCRAHADRFDGAIYCYEHQRRRPPQPRSEPI